MPGNMKISFFPAAGVLSLAFAAVCSASPVWETDWNKALEKAGRGGQPVLVDFTDPGWCHGCIYMRHNILNTNAFAKYAEDTNFRLVELDFPRTAGKLSPEQLKLHEELRHRYGISVADGGERRSLCRKSGGFQTGGGMFAKTGGRREDKAEAEGSRSRGPYAERKGQDAGIYK